VTYANGTFVAVGERYDAGTGYSGVIVTSSDGISWVPQTISGVGIMYLNGVAYGNGTFVAVGLGWDVVNRGAALTSSDGLNWTPHILNTSSNLMGVSYGLGNFVAVGGGGAILSSQDVVSWTTRISGPVEHLHGIAFGNDTFVAVGEPVSGYSKILTSTDLINWTLRTPSSTQSLYGITYGGDTTFLAVGQSGRILQSDPVGENLTITQSGTGTGIARSNPAGINCGTDCSQYYDSGTIVTLTAAPDTGSYFAGWSDGTNTSEALTWKVTMDAAKNVTASFTTTPPPVTTWAKTYGGSGDDEPYSIQQTSDGGYIVAGPTSSFGAGSYDIWVLKLNADGTVAWQKTYGGSSGDYAYSIQQTSDGGYIVAGPASSFPGGTPYAIWVLKLNADGTVAWQKTYGGLGYVTASFIQQTSDGGYIVAGDTSIPPPRKQ
jgi:hypothetical protein